MESDYYKDGMEYGRIILKSSAKCKVDYTSFAFGDKLGISGIKISIPVTQIGLVTNSVLVINRCKVTHNGSHLVPGPLYIIAVSLKMEETLARPHAEPSLCGIQMSCNHT